MLKKKKKKKKSEHKSLLDGFVPLTEAVITANES